MVLCNFGLEEHILFDLCVEYEEQMMSLVVKEREEEKMKKLKNLRRA